MPLPQRGRFSRRGWADGAGIVTVWLNEHAGTVLRDVDDRFERLTRFEQVHLRQLVGLPWGGEVKRRVDGNLTPSLWFGKHTTQLRHPR